MENKLNTVKIKLLDEKAHIPVKATKESAGYDIYSIEDIVIHPREFLAVKTGISIEMDYGLEAQIRPRSGLAIKHGITVLNSPGTIDSDYRGEIKIILINHSNEPFEIKIGERIAQMVFSKILDVELATTDKLNLSERGDGGFGSTGKHKIN